MTPFVSQTFIGQGNARMPMKTVQFMRKMLESKTVVIMLKEKMNEVRLSLFDGFTNNEKQCKNLNTLVEESHGCALLDTGCSTTV